MQRKYIPLFFLILCFGACRSIKNSKSLPVGNASPVNNTNILDSLLTCNPQYFSGLIANKDSFRIQIIYTKIDRDKDNQPVFTDYSFNLNNNLYFYPASTVKMPVAFLALEKLNNMNISGVNKFTPIVTDSSGVGETLQLTQPLAQNSAPTIANYIKQVFLVSDNDAFNRLYEFLGQEYIQSKLAEKGYKDAIIRSRLQVSLTDEQNRLTNAIDFFDTSSNLLYHQPSQYSKIKFNIRQEMLGKGYLKEGQLIKVPFDFSGKNLICLQDLHNILRSVIFPGFVDEKQRFNLTQDDFNFLYRYMSAWPSESNYPYYDTTEFYNTCAKFLLYGAEKVKPDPQIRIFNKVGGAYGFLTDIAYIADFDKKVEFMLSATIYCNSDGIFNDDKYDYDATGYPFMKNLGKVVYEYEIKRKRTYQSDLDKFKIDYNLF